VGGDAPLTRLEIRPPLALRIYTIGFTVVWIGAVVWAAVSIGWSPAVLVPAGMLVFGILLGWRLAGLAVLARGDELLVRNQWRTARVPRHEIEGFREEAGGWTSPLAKVYALLRDGTVLSLDAISLPRLPLRRSRRVDRALTDLRSWLEDAGEVTGPTGDHRPAP
jgi:hypothetical protein